MCLTSVVLEPTALRLSMGPGRSARPGAGAPGGPSDKRRLAQNRRTDSVGHRHVRDLTYPAPE